MAGKAPLNPEERRAIEKALRGGASLGVAAKASGRGRSTVQRIAVAAGIELDRSITKKATAAQQDYNTANRLIALNQFFTKAIGMLATVATPQELAQLTTAFAIMVDKRRLEDGQATSRTEVHDDGARERLQSRVDELASRRQGAA